MLEELHVTDFALIDQLSVRFTKGLNILTGETGAGKSILVGALGLLLGTKGETSSIRSGCDETVVSGTIRVKNNSDVMDWLSSRDITPEDGVLLIRRVVKKTGRGSIFIQSSSVTRSDLQELTSLLFDMHGQHEHQSLLSTDNQRKLLDRFGGHEDLSREVTEEFQQLNSLKKDLEQMEKSERERSRESDILAFAIKEIEEAELRTGEEEELKNERVILSQHEKLYNLLETVNENTAENRSGSLATLRIALEAAAEITKIDQSLSRQVKRLEEAFYEIEDVCDSIRHYQRELDFSGERLEECESRLMTIHSLEKKYGHTIKDILVYKEKSKEDYEKMQHWEEDKAGLQQEIKERERALSTKARQLTDLRKEAGKALSIKIQKHLDELGMPKAVFTAEVNQKKSETGKVICGLNGFDRIEFTISPNIGEPAKPLKSIASGGELSRIMLAIKSILAETDHIQSLIFDEVDSGIGGQVAVAVGEHLYNVAHYKQVLCITHLASIAVRADNHLRVNKTVIGNRTITRVEPVEGEKRVKEIARMLSGDTAAKASISHAEELLRKYSVLSG